MAEIWGVCFTVACIGVIAAALLRTGHLYEYPAFSAVAFLIFIGPQVYSLISFPGGASTDSVEAAVLMAMLCAIACVVGFHVRPSDRLLARFDRSLDLGRVLQGAWVLLAVSWGAQMLIGTLDGEQTGATRWSGTVTVYHFFTGLTYPAFALAFACAVRGRGLSAWLCVVAASAMPIQAMIFHGRRETTATLLLCILLTLFFRYLLKPPRTAFVVAIVVAALAIPATGAYRGLAAARDWSAVAQFDWVDNFLRFATSESVLELRNAANVIEGTANGFAFEYGGAYWDTLVFRFVPAQIVGADVKSGLMFFPPGERVLDTLAAQGITMPVGTTLTGVGDTFMQFGWFGGLTFVLFGMFFRFLWNGATSRGNLAFQVFYMLCAPVAMRAVTHQTVDFLPALVYLLIFVGPVFAYASVRRVPLPGRVVRATAR